MKMTSKNYYKSCFVPQCESTTIKTPSKIFFCVPKDMEMRKKWFKHARRTDAPHAFNYFCCEDHFNLKDDADNYIRCSIQGGSIKLKKETVPHIFLCQPGRYHASIITPRPALQKLTNKRLIQETLDEDKLKENRIANENLNYITVNERKHLKLNGNESMNVLKSITNTLQNKEQYLQKNVSSHQENSSQLETIERNKGKDILSEDLRQRDTRNVVDNMAVVRDDSNYIEHNDLSSGIIEKCTVKSAVKGNQNVNSLPKLSTFGENPGISTAYNVFCTFYQEKNKPGCTTANSAREEKKMNYLRDKGIQTLQKLTKPQVRSKAVSCDLPSQINKCLIDRGCSPINFSKQSSVSKSSSTISSNPVSSSSGTNYEPSTNSSSSNNTLDKEKKEKKKQMQSAALNLTRYFMSVNPKRYIGIFAEWSWICDLLYTYTKCDIDEINMTFMKIKTNDSFERLGDQFGWSASKSSRIFKKTVRPVAACLKKLVFLPEPDNIKLNLPIAFRANYSHTHVILDAFEIEIQKPSDALHQALTWSDYKKCNTLKYLIASTPDGFIVFMSNGYGGRISDTVIFEESNIMSVLPEKAGVMADRGFKQIQTILNKKNCELIRPPSASSSGKMTRTDVMETKCIASLRIHIERVTRRVREYKILMPHSCLDAKMMPCINDVTTIVAGLINLQKPIIRK